MHISKLYNVIIQNSFNKEKEKLKRFGQKEKNNYPRNQARHSICCLTSSNEVWLSF